MTLISWFTGLDGPHVRLPERIVARHAVVTGVGRHGAIVSDELGISGAIVRYRMRASGRRFDRTRT